MSANQLNFAKVLALPATYDPSTIYLVKDPNNPGYVEFYISGQDGNSIYKLPTVNSINKQIANGIQNTSNYYIFSNLVSMDNSIPNGIAIGWVLDTEGDPNTNGLPAPYIFIPNGTAGGNWYCMFNINYLNANVSWSDITSGPQSTPSEIDQVVAWWKQNTATLATLEEEMPAINDWYNTYGDPTAEIINYWEQYGLIGPYGLVSPYDLESPYGSFGPYGVFGPYNLYDPYYDPY